MRAASKVTPISADAAKTALSRFWGTRGDEGRAEAAEECRKLSAEQLRLVEAWIPHGPPGTATGIKCDRARAIVQGVLKEKGA